MERRLSLKHTRTSWIVKLRPDLAPHVEQDPLGHGLILVPTPLLVAGEIRRIRRGRLTTPTAIRRRLAERFHADRTCPLTTGIFLNIIAGAAEEQLGAGKRPVAPWWRVVEENGGLNPKRPPSLERQALHLRSEGHRVTRSPGGTWRVGRTGKEPG